MSVGLGKEVRESGVIMRYIITGGDNGYCCRCGGLCDRVILEVDDDKKTYKVVDEGEGVCLGRWCWHARPCGGGWFLKRYSTFNGAEFECYGGQKYYLVHVDENGNETEKRKVIVKNQKWGKDGEFKLWRNGKIVWDKIQSYKYEGIGEITK